MSGGQIAIRGFLVQTLVGLLEALDDGPEWTHVTLEPNVDSEKVDILWQYADETSKAVQVKSTENVFKKADLARWAGELESWRQADVYELLLIGVPASEAVAKMRHVGNVGIPLLKNLDLQAFKEQAAHKLDGFLHKHRLPNGDSNHRMLVVEALAANLATLSTKGTPLSRTSLIKQLKKWIPESNTKGSVQTLSAESTLGSGLVRLIRIYVSAPDDVAAERNALQDAVEAINRTDGQRHQVRLEAIDLKRDAIPRIGPQTPSANAQASFCEIFIGILSTRYEQENIDAFQAALNKWQNTGTPWIAYYFDTKPSLNGDPEQAEQYFSVCKFRKELQSKGIVGTFSGARGSPASFYESISEHLRKVIHQLVPVAPRRLAPEEPTADYTRYLRDLLDRTAHIDVRGLNTGSGKAHRFGIEELYITVTTQGRVVGGPQGESKNREKSIRGEKGLELSHAVPLDQALRHDRLVVVGDPGAGKTTFLRRIAFALAQTESGDDPLAAEKRLAIRDRTFPILVSISQLAQHWSRCANDPRAPKGETAAAWLPHFLGVTAQEESWGLDEDVFRKRLEKGECTVMLDGLDEAPDRLQRESISRWIGSVTRAYSECRFVVTSRPAAYSGHVILPDFEEARIEPLSDSAVETFVSRWCDGIYAENEDASRTHREELLGSIRARKEIRRMARNPVMLTALAVVHWNETRLPEQRAELYQSIIQWLSRSREQRPGRATAEQTVVRLQELALAMHDDGGGRKTQVSKRWAAERLAPVLGKGKTDSDWIAKAETYLDEEEMDSGIIVGRGKEVTFWHPTFQEFLAAKAVASRLDAEQHEIVLRPADKPYRSEWREVLLLLAGILHGQGKAKVDGLISGIIDCLNDEPTLADQSRCVGIVGAIVRDLRPFDYQVEDARYEHLFSDVMAIFDKNRFSAVDVYLRIAAANALGHAGDPRIDFNQNDYWVFFPECTFLMGAQSQNPLEANFDEHAYGDEWPPHEVTLDAFRLARYPLTVIQYSRFIEDDGYLKRQDWSAGGFGEFQEPLGWEQQIDHPTNPVVGVSWWEAAAYCSWAGFRLPSESEWERVARGTEGRKYTFQAAEMSDTHEIDYLRSSLTPVGVYPINQTPEGVLDMGNVSEWCWDGYDVYPLVAISNPRGPDRMTSKVFRGNSARTSRAAFRRSGYPWYRSNRLGFRLAETSDNAN